LWPEALHAGLFPGRFWLAKNKGKRELLANFGDAAPATPLVAGLQECLVRSAEKRKKHGRLAVTVSDSIAAIALLPWQEGLSSEVELLGYAQLCFEKQGQDIGADWVTHVEYPRYGRPGLAYALPRAWMTSLLDELDTQGIQLDCVLPLSAQVFCSGLGFSRPGLSVFLLFEPTQHCALVFRDGALVMRDVEPLTQTIDATCRRLLARVFANHQFEADKLPSIVWWSTMGTDFPKDALNSYLPDVQPAYLSERAWS